MDEQAALGRGEEERLSDMILRHSCSTLRERLRARSTSLVRETMLALNDTRVCSILCLLLLV